MYADSNCYNVYNGSDKESYSTTIYKNMAVKTIKQHDYDKGELSSACPAVNIIEI